MWSIFFHLDHKILRLIFPTAPKRRVSEQPDPEEKHVGHFPRKGASASTREKKKPEETETVQDLWLPEETIHVWTGRAVGRQHNAHNHSSAEGERSVQEDTGRRTLARG